MIPNQYDLLKTTRFLPLFVTQFFNALNDNIFKNALIILITYKIAQSIQAEQYMIALIGGIFILPFFLFSATAGQLADKYEKSLLIRIIKFLEIVFMGIACLGFYLNNFFLLMSTLFFLGMHSTFFGPIKYSILPDHLRENELIAGNGLIEAGTFIAILVGQIIGGSLILSDKGIFYIAIALLSVAILGFSSSFFIPKAKIGQADLKISFNIFKETRHIIQLTRENKDIFIAILAISWFWFIGATLLTQLPTLTKEILNASAAVFTLFLTAFSLGIGAGSLLCNRLLKGQISTKYVPVAILGMSLFLLDIYFSTRHAGFPGQALFTLKEYLASATHLRILLDIFMLSVCGGLFAVPLYAFIQENSTESQRSRVIAGNNILNALFMVLSAVFIMTASVFHFSIPQLFLLVAICNLFVAIYICKLLPEALVHSFLKWLLQLIYQVEVKGLENYREAGDRVMIIANHTSFLDAALLAAFIPSKLTFAINTDVAKRWWLRPLTKLMHTISLDSKSPFAIKSLIKEIRKNHTCVIFPEGRITVTGSLMKIYEGPGMIADQTKAVLLPVRINGAQYTIFSRMKKKVKTHWRAKITLTILPPQVFTVDPDIKGRQRRQLIGRELYDIMSDMMFQSSLDQKTLFASLLEAKEIHSGKHLILEDIQRKPISYSTLIKSAWVLGTYWQKTLTGKFPIGILLPNINANVINFFALQAIGRVPAMLNYTFGPQVLFLACKTCGLKDVITSQQFVTRAKLEATVQYLLAQGIRIHYIEDIRDKLTLKVKFQGICKNIFPYLFYKKSATSQDPAVILFTSGSEGTAKGVVLSHDNIQANRFQLSARIDFNAQDIIFNALPMFHSFGLNAGILLPVLFGMKTFLYPSPLHYRIIPEYIYDMDATITLGTDTFLQNYAKYANPYDFYSLRYVLAGAEKLKDETQQLWVNKFGLRILQGYGTTEAAPVLSINTPMHYKARTVGRFLPGIHYRIEPIPGIQEGGRLFVKGPNIMLGYLFSDRQEEIVPVQDWYDTGDIVTIDDAGFITIQGRAKRFAKIAGEMISLTAVEQQLMELWPDEQHAAIAVAHPQKGEEIVLLTTYLHATREELLKNAKSKGIAEIQIPRKITILPQLPLLSTGKIDYVAIQALFA